MIMHQKGIPDTTLLKLVSKILKKADLPKGFKIKGRWDTKTITREELIEFVDALTEELNTGGYGVIRRCQTCGNYGHPGRKSMRGLCPSHEGSNLKYIDDFCSYWKPMTKEQIRVRESIDELFKSQNERIGDVPEDSRQGNQTAD